MASSGHLPWVALLYFSTACGGSRRSSASFAAWTLGYPLVPHNNYSVLSMGGAWPSPTSARDLCSRLP
eukprot:2773109-Alexandrium_andersonii.AAC.1